MAEAGLFDATERHHFVGDHAGVDAHQNHFERPDAPHAADVASRNNWRGRTRSALARPMTSFGLEAEQRRDRPKVSSTLTRIAGVTLASTVGS